MTTGAPSAPKPADPVKSAAIMLVIAAVLILVGTISRNWISGGGGEVHIGPMGIEACMDGGRCVDVPTRGVDDDIKAVMVIAMLTGFASAAAAGVLGGIALAGSKMIPFPPKLAQISFGLAAFSMTFFLIRMISEKGEISWAGFPAILGVILASIGTKTLTLQLGARPALPAGAPMPYGNPSQPMQPYGNPSQPMPPYQQPQMAPPPGPPPQQQAMPNCPRCGTQLHFVAQYQRWFCPREQQYL